MAAREYNIKKLGRSYKVSEHFTLGEFLSPRDRVEIVKIADRLLEMLEKLRACLGGDGVATIGINSGFRSIAYNRSIGGASASRHLSGDAADIVCKQNGKRVNGKLICCLCQSLGFKGVALIKGSGYAVHVDMRPGGTYRGDENYGYSNNVGGDFYSYFKVKKAQVDVLKVKQKAPAESEEDDMTKAEVKTIVYEVLAEYMGKKAVEEPANWSKEARDWAKKSSIISGTGVGDEWKSPVDREQLVTVLYRVMQKIDPIE